MKRSAFFIPDLRLWLSLALLLSSGNCFLDTFEKQACISLHMQTGLRSCANTNFDICEDDEAYDRSYFDGRKCNEIGFTCLDEKSGTYFEADRCEG